MKQIEALALAYAIERLRDAKARDAFGHECVPASIEEADYLLQEYREILKYYRDAVGAKDLES